MQRANVPTLLPVLSLLRTSRAYMGAECSEAALAKLLSAQIYVQRWKMAHRVCRPFLMSLL